MTLLDNFSYGSEDNLVFSNHDFRNEIIRGDIRDRELINQIFEKHQFDYVYHIAAITPLPDCQMNPSEASDVNVTGTVTILEASRIYGVKKLYLPVHPRCMKIIQIFLRLKLMLCHQV